MKKILIVLAALALVLSLPMAALADGNGESCAAEGGNIYFDPASG